MIELPFVLLITYCVISYVYVLLNLPSINSEINSKLHLAPEGTKPYQIKLFLFVLWLLSPISLIFFVTR